MFALRPVAVALGLVDMPGGRKRHGAVVPVIGGIAMSIGLGVGSFLVVYPPFWTPVLLAIYLLVVVGTIDDRFDLPANVRLIAQTCAALLVVFASDIVVTQLGEIVRHPIALGVLSVPFTILFVVTVVNAFNLIDGIDGLAGGLALLSLSMMALVSFGTPFFVVTAVASSVVAGFLLFNLPIGFNAPVRSFMGDAGSTVLGLIVAVSGIYLSQGAHPRISPAIGLWFVAVPAFDLFSAFLRRILSGRSPFLADHEHLHHKLADSGLSQRATLGVMLTLAAAFAAIGLIGHLWIPRADGLMVLLWFVALALYYQLIRYPELAVRAVTWVRERVLARSPEHRGRSEPDA